MYSQGNAHFLFIVSITIFLGSVCASVSKSEVGENKYAFVPPVFSSEIAPQYLIFRNQDCERVLVQPSIEHVDKISEFSKPSFLRAMYKVGSANSREVLATTTTGSPDPPPPVVAAEATQLISESYEYADNAAFWEEWLTFNDARSTITTEEARTGKNALRIDYGVHKNVVVHRDFTSTTGEIYMKFYIKLAPTFGAKGFKFARWRSSRPFNAQVEMWLSSSNFSVGGNIYGKCKGRTHPFYTRSFPDWKGGWHKIEVHTVYREGTTKIWSDGVLVANVTGINFGTCVFSNVVVPGNMGASEKGTPDDVLYIDDLEVWDGKPSS